MNMNMKKTIAITLVLLASTILLVSFANAQTTDDAVVVILPSSGGTSDPVPGTYNYANGTTFMLTAKPSDGFQFSYWVISGEFTPGHTTGEPGTFVDPDTGAIIQLPRPIPPASIDSLVMTANPANITCGYGYTFSYQAVFAPVTGGTPAPSPSPPRPAPPAST